MSDAANLSFRDKFTSFIESEKFNHFILSVIVVNAISLGLATSTSFSPDTISIIERVDNIAITIFIFEIASKLYCHGGRFFKSGWNLFDFTIVSMALIPESGGLSVLRALRILRALRLVSAVPQMRRVVQTLISAIPGMLSVAGLILLFFYVGAVLTTNLYGPDFPQWFGSIGDSMFSLFQIMTLESWSMGIVRPVMVLYPTAWIFFVPFILVTTFAVLNLFIGILVDSMQKQSDDEDDSEETEPESENELDGIKRELAEIKALIRDNRE
jgi:voltage-gated sodium channel